MLRYMTISMTNMVKGIRRTNINLHPFYETSFSNDKLECLLLFLKYKESILRMCTSSYTGTTIISITWFSLMTLVMTIKNHNGECCYAECCHLECRVFYCHLKYHYHCHITVCHFVESHYGECLYAECHYAECHYECRCAEFHYEYHH